MGQERRVVLVVAGLLSMAGSLGAQAVTESFDDITTLPSSGWVQTNLSQPLGTTGWFQGNPSVFPAQSGAPSAYIAANFRNTGYGCRPDGCTISNWLLTPAATVVNGSTLRFFTRTTGGPPDRLEVRLSTNGDSTDVGGTATSVGDFASVLLTINPNLQQGGYPTNWSQFTATVAGVPSPTLGRFAFRYFVTDGGPEGNNGNYIGIDTVTVSAAPAVPSVSVNDVALFEGNAGITNAVFTVSLSAATAQQITVGYATANGTAVAPGDYGAASGSLTFQAGTTTRQVSVAVAGDTQVELDETFTLNLNNPVGATIADGQGVGTIRNDDVLPTVSITDVSIVEGNTGTLNATFTVTLSTASSQEVRVTYATADGTANAPLDYVNVTGPLIFPAQTTMRQVLVPVRGDTVPEFDETFTLNLSAPVNATIADGQGVGTIINDDLPAVSVNDVTVTEGDTGSLNATFTVSLSQAAPFDARVDYGLAAGTATAGADFGAVAGPLDFPAGTTTRTVAVPILGDRIDEPNETYFVNLSAPSGATVADGQGQGTIVDNDPAGLSISDVVVRERVTPNISVANFTVTLSPTLPDAVTVNWATANGTATAGSDYVAGSGTLTFDPGVATRLVGVAVNPDALVEGMETFVVNLSGAVGATIASPVGTARVLDPPGGEDFDGDDLTDILWRHDVSGENVLWFMDGATLISGTFTTPPTLTDTRWKMVGTNDFNADGHPDILWRHATSGENVLWYMNGSVMQSGTFLTPSTLADVRWGMTGTGDFNVDGHPDILWRHSTSGEIVVWLMNGSVMTSGTFLTPPAFTELNWESVGTGDFNSDGKTDILWRHALSGQNVVWFLEGTSLMSGAFTNPPALADVDWRMVATGDYNSDGKVDIVWRHSVSGQNVIWFMDGINLISGTFTNPSSMPDVDWKIVGPR